MKLFNIQHNPNIHPTVVSPLSALQLNTMSISKLFPATRAEKRIRAVAEKYHSPCSIKICVKILRGGNSDMAPGRGGRRRRAILLCLCM